MNVSESKVKLGLRLEMFESILLGNTQQAAGKMLGMQTNSVHWECRKIFEMIVHSGLRDPMMEPPGDVYFGWRVLRNNSQYWQGQLNYLKRHFGIKYDTPLVRGVIPTRFKTMRNVEIFERVINGERCQSIADDIGVTVSAVLQVWKLVAKYCSETAVLNNITPPPIPTLGEIRKNKEPWVSYLEMFKKTLEGK